jgi:glutamate/aspartate transport system permease protein
MMFSDFDVDVIARSWAYLFQVGMLFTVQLTVLAMLGGVVLGTLLALARLSGVAPLALAAAGYVNLIRAVPLVLVIFWFYFLVPYLAAWLIGAAEQVKVGTFWSALITFTLFQAAYYCEIMRGGIQAIPRGQVLAAQALGLRYWPTMGRVVLPQALRNMLPVLLTQTIVLFQDVSLVYVLSVPDFVGAASKIAQRDGRLVEMYSFVAAVYFVLCSALSWLARRLQNRVAIAR